MVLNVPEIPPKVTKIVTPSGGEGLGKTTLSLSKDVTIRLGRGVKGKSISAKRVLLQPADRTQRCQPDFTM